MKFSLGEGEGGGEDLKDQCFHAIRKALALKPKDHTLWNILGVFALHHEDMPLAQHAFIRSITLLSNSVSWSNLGIMYFMQGRTDLANKAFQVNGFIEITFLTISRGYQGCRNVYGLVRTKYWENHSGNAIGDDRFFCDILISLDKVLKSRQS